MTEAAWERQRRTFETTAEAYDLYRPNYPDELFDGLRDYADLAPGDDRILDIGCGPGIATKHLAQWPNDVLAIEPAPAMAEVARRNLASFKNVEVLTTSFEDWQLEPGAFGLAVCAQSFHWLDPATKYQRIADALYAHGTVALMWNVPVTPASHRTFFERVQSVYHRYAPQLAHKGEFRTQTDERGADELRATGLFEDVTSLTFPWRWTLTRDHYLGLMSSHSPHAALADDARSRLLAGIGELIDDEFAGHVTEHYVAELNLGRKR